MFDGYFCIWALNLALGKGNNGKARGEKGMIRNIRNEHTFEEGLLEETRVVFFFFL